MNTPSTLMRADTPWWGIAILLAASAPALAQTTPPTAGQTVRELQGAPAAPAARNAPSLLVPADTDPGADPGQAFPIQTVRIEGNSQIDSAVLQVLVAPLNGRSVTLGELREAAKRITALYRAHGFIVARAFVPAQEIRDGVVRMTVLEGRLNSTSVINKSIIGTPSLEAIVATQRLAGKVIQSAESDRELLLMADLPGAGAVNGMLKPGKEVGTSDMWITVDPGKSYEGQVSADTYGNRYTGQYRLNGNIDVNSPLEIGDRLSLRGTATDQQLFYGQMAYDLPANGDGWRVGANLSSISYALGHEFDKLDARGTAYTGGLSTSYPALRGLNANIWLRGALDARKLKDDVRSTATVTKKTVKVATMEAYGDLADAFAGGGYNTWRATLTAGKLAIDSAAALLIDQAGPKSNGSYTRYNLALTRLQAITPQTSVYVSFSGQLAGKNLDSSEKFVLGGMYGVRAYPQGEGVGDQGWLTTVELRHDFMAGVQASAFFDGGHIDYNHHAFAAGTNQATYKGAGLAVAGRYQAYELKATVAWRIGDEALSAPDHNPRLWLAASRSF